MKIRSLPVGLALAAVAIISVAHPSLAQDAPAPAEPAQQAQPEKKKRKAIYDESAVASEQIAAAIAKASRENRRVLIQWGANWCGWCHLLHDLCAGDKDLKRKLSYEYDVVLVDIGRWDKNVDLAERYGADIKNQGVPYLTVLDGSGEVVANQEPGSLEDGTKHHPAKVMAFLEKHQAPYLNAESVLNEGLARAAKENQRVFLHFGAPWCGWCHRLEGWMAGADVAEILAKDFVDVKIDTDRMIGGMEMMARYTKGARTGIPWYAVLDAEGEVLVTSSAAGGNIGFPWEPQEIEAFAKLIAEGATRITPEEIEKLSIALTETRREIESRR
jgi:thiol:disulfide interchange protein